MSGPKTSRYSLRAARQQQQAARQAAERKRREEMAARVATAKAKCSTLEKRSARLAIAVRNLQNDFPMETVAVTAPDFGMPQSEDPQPLEDYAVKVEADLARAEALLLKVAEQAKANHEFRNATQKAAELCAETEISAEEAMQRFLQKQKSSISKKLLQDRYAEIDRILGRYASEGWDTASPKLEHLVMEAMSTDSDIRFSALTTEIRRQIQEMKKLEAAFKVDAKKAGDLLEHLDQEIPTSEQYLKQRLELVRVGAIALSDGIETQVNDAIAKARQASRLRLQKTATGIVRGALMDLGYEVAAIESTLFVKGGKVYFRKSGWNDYCVRLTVRPDEGKINFNVVKVSDQESATRSSASAADIEAENAWCSGYQQLVDTLKARGLETELTRHLPVGSIPVPVVGSNEVSLEAFGAPSIKRKAAPKLKRHRGDTI